MIPVRHPCPRFDAQMQHIEFATGLMHICSDISKERQA